ncbi:myelin-oligodendrocyte glycoprotein isoform X2 [Oreochromis niloticus]|uniref:myelin-oligodendrocyte glycoprotein isoform X2 n=1 Tax=Oreochromis niloticus TaxID=8128 RepID=UPI00090477BA|nr:myelin-oligodendrocyte glycoprotein isoform X2 [Oreochromis niloticus]
MTSLIIFLYLSLIVSSIALQQDVQAKLGADVTLQCQISTDERISVLKWSRPDLNTDGYVYFYRNKRSYENYQHPSFHGRVKLRDPEMKDGDVSLILNNVTFNDTGMYECHIALRKPVRSKRAHTEISHFINLTVTGEMDKTMSEQQLKEKGATDGNMYDRKTETLSVQVVVVVIVLVTTVIGFMAFLRFKRSKEQFIAKPSDESEEMA